MNVEIPATRRPPTWERAALRSLDILAASLALLLMAPVLLALALWVRLDSPGPALLRQDRVGKGGETFTLYKFRSMRVGGDDRAHRELIAAELRGEVVATNGSTKLAVDPRITRAGSLLRKTSLDEIPQLLNVLKGDMALVGPRPCLPWEAEMFPPSYAARFAVRPGLTGLWQVSGRSTVGTLDMLELDVDYVRTRRLRLDLWILIFTIPSLLRGGRGTMTTLFLATTGGHLEQLDSLAARIAADGPAVWVTHENDQSRSLLQNRDVEFVPYVRVGSLRDVAGCLPHAHRLLRERSLTRVVSTGSGIALGYLPYLAARGVECHYIESAARVTAPSRTGSVMQRVPRVRRYTQYAHWAGPRWAHRGSVFDSYGPGPVPRPLEDVVRVVVTVGTAAEFPFGRLIDRLAPLLAADGALAQAVGLPVEVLWQTGCTPTGHLPIDAVPFMGGDVLTKAISEADLVVSHAGVGSALTALSAGLRPLLASRSAALGEAGDDHQGQLAAELQRRELAVHREAPEITVDDLLTSLSSGVRHSATPPRFELLP